jgi:hypothetical protein
MSIGFFCSTDLEAGKNDRRISFISHDLNSTLTGASPKTVLSCGGAHDA